MVLGLWSSYLGGTADDYGQGIAVDARGRIYFSGYTGSSGWVHDGWDTSHNGGFDGYVIKAGKPENDTAARGWTGYE